MIAKLIGKPRNSRQIGYALKHLPNENAQRSAPMSVQFDPADGFLDERMFINASVEESDSESSSQEEESDDDHSSPNNDSTQTSLQPGSNSIRPRRRKRPKYHNQNVPWWRVLGSGGTVSVRERVDARDLQVQRLRQEGIECESYRVNMNEYEWDPESSLFYPLDE